MTELLDDASRRLYREVLARGGRVMFREALAQAPDATRRLVGLGLLVHFESDESLTAVNPRTVAARLSSELRTEAGRRLAEAERTPAQLDGLAQAFEASVRRPDRTTVVRHVDRMEEIRHRVLQIESEAHEEILAAQPGGARPVARMAKTRQHNETALAGGVELRTLYQPGATTDRPTAAYAAELSDRGQRFRVLDEPFRRMLVFDRKVAVVPAADDDASAAFVEDPVLVALLVERFERDWARATVVDWHALAGRPRESGVPPELTDLLAAGLTQRAIASRLGLSERTVAAHLARLREHHGAETLFQLGWLMRKGTR
ncbi:LuxR C-terminal-related transcriptional regulator [Kitasatospora sp. NPDC057198]|uniref:LuxR C-terminal-related transcriptional regulator n=1 Tax=Kitasatospora sp. NPDC057198 TaxID=3346046 RepID=UPI00363B9B5A